MGGADPLIQVPRLAAGSRTTLRMSSCGAWPIFDAAGATCCVLQPPIGWPLRSSSTAIGHNLVLSAPQEAIPGSDGGEAEAGLQGDRLHARLDTPVHSTLHAASHYIGMTPARRADLDRDAGIFSAELAGIAAVPFERRFAAPSCALFRQSI